MDFTITNNGGNPIVINFRDTTKYYPQLDSNSLTPTAGFDTVTLNPTEGRAFYDCEILSIKELGV